MNDYFGEGHFGSLSRQDMTGKKFTRVVLNFNMSRSISPRKLKRGKTAYRVHTFTGRKLSISKISKSSVGVCTHSK